MKNYIVIPSKSNIIPYQQDYDVFEVMPNGDHIAVAVHISATDAGRFIKQQMGGN